MQCEITKLKKPKMEGEKDEKRKKERYKLQEGEPMFSETLKDSCCFTNMSLGLQKLYLSIDKEENILPFATKRKANGHIMISAIFYAAVFTRKRTQAYIHITKIITQPETKQNADILWHFMLVVYLTQQSTINNTQLSK